VHCHQLGLKAKFAVGPRVYCVERYEFGSKFCLELCCGTGAFGAHAGFCTGLWRDAVEHSLVEIDLRAPARPLRLSGGFFKFHGAAVGLAAQWAARRVDGGVRSVRHGAGRTWVLALARSVTWV
jgi:hypothetical protein